MFQLLSLLYIHVNANPDVYHVEPRNTRAGTRKKFKTMKYENAKYHDSPCYKASKLWDTLPQEITNIASLNELKKLIKTDFSPFDEIYFQI